MCLSTVVYFLLFLVALIVVLAALFGNLYANDRRPDAVHFVQTRDGWKLALHYYAPVKGAKKKRPVLCCHGLSGNHHSYDLTERTSIARLLAAQGHPTFTLDLRGAGLSEKGGPCRRHPLRWILSDHYNFDIPAAVDKVCELTGAKKIHYVGHSMGGMIAYCFLQMPVAEKIDRCVILASPANLEHMRPAHKLTPLRYVIPGIPLRKLTQCVAPMFEWFRPLQLVSGNINLRPGDYTLSAANCQDQTPMSLLVDLARCVEHGHLLGDDGRDLTESMGEITTPTLIMCGKKDATVGFGPVLEAYERIGADEKKWVPLGEEFGQDDEYGHMTILVGKDVDREVHPHIADWLAKG